MNLFFMLTHCVVAICLVRLWFQLTAVSVYNPISQIVLKVCAPFLAPMQAVIPNIGRFNLSVLLLAVSVYSLSGYFFLFISIDIFRLVIWALLQTVSLFLTLFFWAIVASVVISWLARENTHPVVDIINQSVSPVLDAVRRFLPAFAGLDFSPVVVFIAIQLIKSQVLARLYQLAGVPWL